MMRPADSLNTPMVLAVVLVLVLVVEGLLLHRYQLAKGATAATPSLDTALAGPPYGGARIGVSASDRFHKRIAR